ncbi:hypothetical protein IV417_17865 [Alphaproteobacteria bacterium KMM 3653]|uniref:NADH dehydrogenase subunit E n=1 Tax=Harenicola maris TaxID=2841044 RepID=A0AAP2CRZ7_9RHOB|nr:hypothetical protein [Harenicola maris]
MFKEWGFLLTEIWLLLAIAGLIGLFAGYLIWNRGSEAEAEGAGNADADAQIKAHKAEMAELTTRLDRCRSDGQKKDARIKEVEAELDELRSQAAFTAPVAAYSADDDGEQSDGSVGIVDGPVDFDGDGVAEGRDEGSKPETLDGPRGGVADDLKMIKGIGPKMEALCNSLGFYHFDQIAGWTADEAAWVDANLTGFKGRATRDRWIEQAQVLASGGETEFSKRVEDGGVYD